ncbi:hypothetical protein ACJ72_06740 [Emergomyces africanus]|uniref:Methyltransferase type 11 domain-containing protein n=1 Tax=Emergomyces africanus TaxID=1955775 RepID=A0A1B7NQ86_9EURO|nr:hypothetical protein ACJ72_06740 [Emergomyces africanus]
MAETDPKSTSSFQEEKTFRSYTPGQGSTYAQSRPGYDPEIYQLVVDHHTSTGGQLGTILDVGCGPGTAVRGLAPYFAHAIGLDPSEGMINAARSLSGSASSSTSTQEPISFHVSTAEELGAKLSPPIADNSIDLVTAATAAHWFDMARFWTRAAQVLKPGGSVAIWAGGNIRVSPSMPNSAAIQAIVDEFDDKHLGPYMEPGNLLVRNLYSDLQLPWTAGSASEFDESSLIRKVWDGTGDDDGDSRRFLMNQVKVDLNTLEKMIGTGSPITRWREAHPDTAGTEQDVVKIFRRGIERVLHESGVEKGKEVVEGNVTGVFLIVKKKG